MCYNLFRVKEDACTGCTLCYSVCPIIECIKVNIQCSIHIGSFLPLDLLFIVHNVLNSRNKLVSGGYMLHGDNKETFRIKHDLRKINFLKLVISVRFNGYWCESEI